MTPAGGGYPKPRRPRTPHFASRVIRVCDVYDALRCKRPYRDAWPAERALRYLVEYGSREVDAEIAQAFVAMMRQWDPGLHPEGAETAEWRERGQGSRFV